MNLLDKKKEALQQLVLITKATKDDALDVDNYFSALRTRSMSLAKIVHEGQVDKAGKPYIQHAMRVAAKASNLLGFIGGILHDVVEDGEELGVTLEFLRDKLLFPQVIIDIVDTLTRRKGESYCDYQGRLARNYQAAKVKLDDNIDNANITRFDHPTKQDQIHCAAYLEKAWVLKSQGLFQLLAPWDFLVDIVNLSQLAPMLYVADEYYSDEKVIYSRFYFGYEGYQHRRYTFIFNGVINQEDGSVRATLSTYPSISHYAEYQIYTPRRVTIEFKDTSEVLAYIDHYYRMLNIPTMKIATVADFLNGRALHVALQEDNFVKSLDMFNA